MLAAGDGGRPTQGSNPPGIPEGMQDDAWTYAGLMLGLMLAYAGFLLRLMLGLMLGLMLDLCWTYAGLASSLPPTDSDGLRVRARVRA